MSEKLDVLKALIGNRANIVVMLDAALVTCGQTNDHPACYTNLRTDLYNLRLAIVEGDRFGYLKRTRESAVNFLTRQAAVLEKLAEALKEPADGSVQQEALIHATRLKSAIVAYRDEIAINPPSPAHIK